MLNMFQIENKRHQNNVNLLTLNIFWCFYCYLWTYFKPCSSVSIVNFGRVFGCCEWSFFINQSNLDWSFQKEQHISLETKNLLLVLFINKILLFRKSDITYKKTILEQLLPKQSIRKFEFSSISTLIKYFWGMLKIPRKELN